MPTEPPSSGHDAETIVNEHRQMAALIETLKLCVTERRGKDDVCQAANALANYARQHFDHEKALMTDHHYPETYTHLWQHRELLDQLDMLIRSFEGASADIADYTTAFIDTWFTDHVSNSDARLAAFLAGG